ncbi:hypothetical protein [Fodinicurvata sp. EGI_FJ10296]|uniref:hypothetical protein n=1 Tax=Fodinicurvata sp. EGI_FJ10296 TaxID=3231908 RepID=UPI003451382E
MATRNRDSIRRDMADQPRASAEYALLDYAERLERFTAGRMAVHIHLSRLQSYNRREHHTRVATTTFEDTIKSFDGQLFQLSNKDLVFVCKGGYVGDLDQAVLRLRYLFSEDPLTQYKDDDTDAGFCTWYRLESDYERFLESVRRLYETSEREKREAERVNATMSSRGAEPPRKPLTPQMLGSLVSALEKADLSSMIRMQPICALAGDQDPEPVFSEKFVSIGELEKTALDNVSIAADPWLFKHLTYTLDKRMMRQIESDQGSDKQPFSLNLNVGTILSEEFERFDKGVGIGLKGRLVIELQKMDIFSDMGAYMFARDYLHEKGYKVCLDAMTHLTLPFVDRERLGLDLVKIFWSPELLTPGREKLLDDLETHVQKAGRARIIMARCDDRNAIEMGRRLGISLFQGYHIDKLLAKRRAPGAAMGSVGPKKAAMRRR